MPNNKSETEQYWEALAAKASDPRKWNDLRVQEQHVVITSINMILSVLRIERKEHE